MLKKSKRRLYKNKFIRNLHHKREMKKIILKFLRTFIKNNTLFTKILHYFQKYQRYSSISLVRSICLITFKYRSIIRKFGLSRITFKKVASFGLLPGLRRSSW